MGYRSDVALALSHAAALKLHELVKVTEDRDKTSLVRMPERHVVDEATGHEIFYWEYMKWYDDDRTDEAYKDVCFVADFIDSLESSEYLFCRVGEDTDDTEIRGEFWSNPFDLGIVRRIEFSNPNTHDAGN